ncbi:MAG TPA: hypothetical protein VES42_13115, partial [Pilimelia sp.]|nr:hypothetical protein [Pilimelia sp.]
PARLAPLAHGVRRLLQLGAAYGLLAPVLVACAATGDRGLSRVQAVALGVIGVGMLAVLATRLPGRVREVLPPLMRADRALAVAVYGVAAGPILVLLYAVVGTPWPLAAAVAAGFAALLANVLADYRT